MKVYRKKAKNLNLESYQEIHTWNLSDSRKWDKVISETAMYKSVHWKGNSLLPPPKKSPTILPPTLCGLQERGDENPGPTQTSEQDHGCPLSVSSPETLTHTWSGDNYLLRPPALYSRFTQVPPSVCTTLMRVVRLKGKLSSNWMMTLSKHKN